MTETYEYLHKLLGACCRVTNANPCLFHGKQRDAVAARSLLYSYLRHECGMRWEPMARLTGHTHPVAYTLAGPRAKQRFTPEQYEQVVWWMSDVERPAELSA